MSSDSELDEFFDAEDATPKQPVRKTSPTNDDAGENLAEEEQHLLELKKTQEMRRKQEDMELEKRLHELQKRKREQREKQKEAERKSHQNEVRRRKLEEMRQKMLYDGSPHRMSISDSEPDDDDWSGATEAELSFQAEPERPLDRESERRSPVHDNRDKFSDFSDNIDSSFPDKDKPSKVIEIDSLQDDPCIPGSDTIVDDVLKESSMRSENEPDIVKSTKPRSPPNTLPASISPPISESYESTRTISNTFPRAEKHRVPPLNLAQCSPTGLSCTARPAPPPRPTAPPRRKKHGLGRGSTSTDERDSTCSSPSDFDPQSPGLPTELLTPTSTVDIITKALEQSLDLKSALGGGRHINAEDAELDAVNSDMDSPRQNEDVVDGSVPEPVTDSPRLDNVTGHSGDHLPSNQAGVTSKTGGVDENIPRPRSNSGRLLTDEEILASVTVTNLDTGERIDLSSAEKELPECMNPLSLHIMRITKEYNSEQGPMNEETMSIADGRTESGKSESRTRAKAAKLRRFIGHRVGKTVSKVKSVADQMLHGEEPNVEEDLSDEGKQFKTKAYSRNKGPYDFAQLKLLQDLSGEHTGAIWTMRFSPCGRLLATGGQDSVVRIWVLKVAYSYFDDMRQKYADVTVSPAASHESLDTILSSETTDSEAGATVGSEAEEDREMAFKKKPFCTYRGHSADLLDISWSKNYFILSSSMDKTVRLWHISRRECLCTFQHIDFVTAIVFHPRDDRYFLSGSLDGKLRLWNIPDKKVTLWNEVSGPSTLITTANFCHNGKFAVVGTYDGRCVFYSTEQLKYYTQIHVRSTRGKNARGRKITGIEPLPGEDKVLVTSNDSRIRLYDLRDLTLTCKYKGATNNSSQIRACFSPKGKYIISGSEDHFVYIWKTQHEYYKFSSARRDRNYYWEAIKVHNAVVTAAVFVPNPALFSPPQDTAAPSKDNIQDQRQIIITADFSGAIKVIQNKV